MHFSTGGKFHAHTDRRDPAPREPVLRVSFPDYQAGGYKFFLVNQEATFPPTLISQE